MPFGKSWQALSTRRMRLSWDEVATRGIQGISKRVEAGLYRVGVKARSARLQDGPLPVAHFLFGPAELAEILTLLRQRLPHEVDQITEEAERICQHRFDLLGYRHLDYGREIDWHLDRELESLARIADGRDFAEGLEGFFERRPARFQGK